MLSRTVLTALVCSAVSLASLSAAAAIVPSLADAPVCRCTATSCQVVGEVVDSQARPIFGAQVQLINPWTYAPYASFTTDLTGVYAGVVPVTVGAMVRERVTGQVSTGSASRCTAVAPGEVDERTL